MTVTDRPVVRVAPVAALVGSDPRRLAATVLDECEHARWQRWGETERGREWLAGRVLAKSALMRLTQLNGGPALGWADVTIEAEPAGPQQGRLIANCRGEVSVSHSAGLAAAAAHVGPVGIDVESHARRWPDILGPVVATMGAGMTTDHGAPLCAHSTWTCFEAVRKQEGVGLRGGVDEFRLTSVDRRGHFSWAGAGGRHGMLWDESGFALGLAWSNTSWA